MPDTTTYQQQLLAAHVDVACATNCCNVVTNQPLIVASHVPLLSLTAYIPFIYRKVENPLWTYAWP